jgi:CheY-like chemotaxis protein
MLSDLSSHSVPKTVLVVEDNELSLMLLKDFLENHGYAILATGLGETAIELARQHRPNLILMDVQLPDISGTEAARQLKSLSGNIRWGCRAFATSGGWKRDAERQAPCG